MENLFKEEINKKLKNIVFIELKEEYQLEDIKLPVGFSLPIKLDYIIEGIKEKELEEEINLEKIVDAMIYLLGIDSKFKYAEEYKDVLKALKIDIKNYAMHKAFVNQEEDPLDSYLYLKGYEEVKGKDEKAEKLLNIIIKKYNEVLNLDERYSLSYYRLAYINLSLEKYIKANMYFEKFINLSDSEELKDEVRKEMEIIKDSVNFDSAKTYLSYGEYNKALNLLKGISENFNKDEKYYYVVAITFYNLGDLESAEEFARESVDKKILEENVNLLSTLYAGKNKFDDAIEVLEMGLSEIENSYPLNYNLGIIYLNKNMKEKGIEYLEKALEINPNKDLEKFIKNMK